jgi:hypothetical protein
LCSCRAARPSSLRAACPTACPSRAGRLGRCARAGPPGSIQSGSSRSTRMECLDGTWDLAQDSCDPSLGGSCHVAIRRVGHVCRLWVPLGCGLRRLPCADG